MKACATMNLQININFLGLLLIKQAKPKLHVHHLMVYSGQFRFFLFPKPKCSCRERPELITGFGSINLIRLTQDCYW